MIHPHHTYPVPPQAGGQIDGDPFNPAGLVWQPVSPALAKVRLVGTWIFLFVLILSVAGVGFLTATPGFFLIAGGLGAVGLWLSWLLPRQVRAMAYAEGGEEFYYRRGIMFRRLTVVPYGRMQYVDISRGPIARKFGIAELKLHTAAFGTDMTVNGITHTEADRLRRKLTALGEAKMAGL